QPTNRAAYVEPIIQSSLLYRFPRITVALEDPPEARSLTGTSVLVFNLPRYALGLPFAPEARDDDGFLDLVVFRKPGPFQALRYLWLLLLQRHPARRSVRHRRIRRIRITSSAAVPVQLDGAPAGTLGPGEDHAWYIEAIPRALEVVTS